MLKVIDHTAYLLRQIRKVFNGSPLHLCGREFFSDNQWVSSDGAFEGGRWFFCSYKNPGHDPDRICYNLALHEVRQGVQTSYGRVDMWFPLLGNNNKKLPYSGESPVSGYSCCNQTS